jgi:ribonuclease Z
MTTTVVVTGTGNPIPDPRRAGPGVAVRYNNLTLQFDAGRHTATRLVEAKVPLAEVAAVFVTHHHSDHLFGLDDLVLSRWAPIGNHHPALTVVAPAGPCIEFAQDIPKRWHADIATRIEHTGRTDELTVNTHGFEATSEPTTVWQSSDGAVEVDAIIVDHGCVIPAVGYRVRTPDGSIAISGDCVPCDGVRAIAQDADVLIHEAMNGILMTELSKVMPRLTTIMNYHSDAAAVGLLALQSNVRKLVLTHLMPAPNTAEEIQAFVDQVRSSGFLGDLDIAEDLLAVVL